MKRSDFLKVLGMGVTGLVIPSNTFLNTKELKIYDNYVRGLTHYNFRKVRKELKAGDSLQLEREPDNQYDSFAIRVNYGQLRLGYIAAYENIVLANMLDAGVNLTVKVSKVTSHGNLYTALAIEVYAELIVSALNLSNLSEMSERADDLPDIYRLNEKWS